MSEQKPKHKPWTQEEKLESGRVAALISSREGTRGGKQYSLKLARKSAFRPLFHFEVKDFDDIVKVLGEAKVWIDCDREETRKKSAKLIRRA